MANFIVELVSLLLLFLLYDFGSLSLLCDYRLLSLWLVYQLVLYLSNVLLDAQKQLKQFRKVHFGWLLLLSKGEVQCLLLLFHL